MFTLKKSNNPISAVLAILETTPKPVTMQMLDWIVATLEIFNYKCETYSEAIAFLELMEQHNLIVMEKGQSGTYTIFKTNIMDNNN